MELAYESYVIKKGERVLSEFIKYFLRFKVRIVLSQEYKEIRPPSTSR
jgi:hypothetical protein